MAYRNSANLRIRIVGWGRTQAEPGFGATYDSTSVKAKSVNLIASVRTVMRSTLIPLSPGTRYCLWCSSHREGILQAEGSSKVEDWRLMRTVNNSTAHRHQHNHHRLRTHPRLIPTPSILFAGPRTHSDAGYSSSNTHCVSVLPAHLHNTERFGLQIAYALFSAHTIRGTTSTQQYNRGRGRRVGGIGVIMPELDCLLQGAHDCSLRRVAVLRTGVDR